MRHLRRTEFFGMPKNLWFFFRKAKLSEDSRKLRFLRVEHIVAAAKGKYIIDVGKSL